MEKRNRERMVLTVFCRVAPVSNRRKSAWKRIENISGAGLLVEWSRGDQEQPVPNVGEIFSVELQLPPHPVFGQRVLQYKARIVRVSRQKNGRILAGLQTTQTRFKALTPGSWQQTAEQHLVQ
jgi:hypothetical protein